MLKVSPFVLPKANVSFSRNAEIYDTTIGWRFVNPIMKKKFGIDSMPETAENVAEKFQISREDQDNFALNSQKKALHAISYHHPCRLCGIPDRRRDVPGLT